MGNARPKPQHLAKKLQAIRDHLGVSQYRLAKSLHVGRTIPSAFESGRRMPNWFVLLRYARLAGIPLEFIVDDDIDLDFFERYLKTVGSKRVESNDPPETTEHRMVLFWRK